MATANTDHRPRFEHVLLFVLREDKGIDRKAIVVAMNKRKYPLTESALSRWTSAGERRDATPWGAAIRTERIEGETWEKRGLDQPKPGRKKQLIYLTPEGARFRDEVIRPFYASLLS